MIRNPIDLYKKSFLPSRRLRIILGIIAGIVILVWLVPHVWAWIRTPGTGKELPEPINPVVATPGDNYLDSDDDGIPDWKEHFIRTYGVIEGENGETNASETLSLLDSIPDTQKVALEIAAQVEAGGASAIGTGAVTEQAILEYVHQLSSQFKTYSTYDIVIGDLDNIDEQRVYASQIQKTVDALQKTLTPEKVSEITNSILDEGSDVNKKLRLQNSVRDEIRKTLAISVPPSAVTVHLEFINSLYALEQTLLLKSTSIQTDPLRAFGLLALMKQGLDNIFTAQTNLAGYFFITLDQSMYTGV